MRGAICDAVVTVRVGTPLCTSTTVAGGPENTIVVYSVASVVENNVLG